MKWQGFKEIPLKSLRMGDAADIRKRMKQPHVVELADTIAKTGGDFIQAPTVRMPMKELLIGRDRTAAKLVRKDRKMWVRLVECDDVEAKRLEQIENLYRRPVENRTQLIADLVAEEERAIRAAGRDNVPPSQVVKGEARKAVARAAGISTAAVRKAEQRAKAAAEPAPVEDGDTAFAAGDADQRAEPAPTLDRLGIDDASVRAVEKFARQDQEAIDAADQLLRQAQAALARMTPGTVAQELKEQVHRVASLVRAARPESVCPWCKGLPKSTVPRCAPCDGAGYVPAVVRGRAPSELTASIAPLVAIDGVFMPYEDVRDGKLPAKNGKPATAAKHVRVEDADGNVLAADEDQAY